MPAEATFDRPPRIEGAVTLEKFFQWRSDCRAYYADKRERAQREQTEHERKLEIIREQQRYSFLHGFGWGVVFMGTVSMVVFAVILTLFPILPLA